MKETNSSKDGTKPTNDAHDARSELGRSASTSFRPGLHSQDGVTGRYPLTSLQEFIAGTMADSVTGKNTDETQKRLEAQKQAERDYKSDPPQEGIGAGPLLSPVQKFLSGTADSVTGKNTDETQQGLEAKAPKRAERDYESDPPRNVREVLDRYTEEGRNIDRTQQRLQKMERINRMWQILEAQKRAERKYGLHPFRDLLEAMDSHEMMRMERKRQDRLKSATINRLTWDRRMNLLKGFWGLLTRR